MNSANVHTIMCRITGDSESDDLYDLVDRAMARLTALLKVSSLDREQVERCEYAAGCDAAYERTLELAGCQQLVMSENGEVRRGSGSRASSEAARELREHAYAAVADLINDEGVFVFRQIGE